MCTLVISHVCERTNERTHAHLPAKSSTLVYFYYSLSLLSVAGPERTEPTSRLYYLELLLNILNCFEKKEKKKKKLIMHSAPDR